MFRVGLGLIVLSAVFFLRYSIDQGWIGPLARVALAAGAGLGLIGVGVAVRRPAYGVLLQGAGVVVLFLTAYAAHDHYGLTSTTEAFLQLAVVSTLTLGLAERSKSELLAGLGLVAAAVAPALIDGRMAVSEAETGYVLAVALASTVLAFRHGWMRAQVATAAGIAVSIALDLTPPNDRTAAVALQVALTIAWLMAVAVPLVGAIRDIGDRVSRVTIPIVTSSVGSLLFYAATRLIFPDGGNRMAGASLAMTLAAAHVMTWRLLGQTPHLREVSLAQMPAVVSLLAVATVEGLTGDWVLVGTSVLSLGLILAGHRPDLGGHRRLADAGHLLFFLTAVLGVGAASIVTGGTRTWDQLVPGSAILLTAAAIGWFVRDSRDTDLAPVYLGAAYSGAVLWMAVELPRLGSEGAASVTAGWMVLGVGAVVVGRLLAVRPLLGAGFGTIGLSLGKLFFVDLAEATPLTRIGLFAGVGLLLVGGGYWLGDWSLETGHGDTAESEDATQRVPDGTPRS
jgi:uncharacterized membrane protein